MRGRISPPTQSHVRARTAGAQRRRARRVPLILLTAGALHFRNSILSFHSSAPPSLGDTTSATAISNNSSQSIRLTTIDSLVSAPIPFVRPAVDDRLLLGSGAPTGPATALGDDASSAPALPFLWDGLPLVQPYRLVAFSLENLSCTAHRDLRPSFAAWKGERAV
jgi:hypothetical protein